MYHAVGPLCSRLVLQPQQPNNSTHSIQHRQRIDGDKKLFLICIRRRYLKSNQKIMKSAGQRRHSLTSSFTSSHILFLSICIFVPCQCFLSNACHCRTAVGAIVRGKLRTAELIQEAANQLLSDRYQHKAKVLNYLSRLKLMS